MRDLKHFIFWCQKVIPLVYDESLSYYEVLCKCVDYINKLIDSDKEIVDSIDDLKADMVQVQEWIDSFNYEPLLQTVAQMVQKYITAGVYFGLTEAGYFVAYIPKAWDKINFRTTGYDMDIDLQPEYGHLVLLY